MEATVYGRVQGVNFRNFTRLAARRLGLSGEVGNLPDSTVRVRAEGEETGLRALVKQLQQGPPGSRVEKVTTRWSEFRGDYTDFSIAD
ncbi:MAG: acylphosphatase [Chloroflexota bacterium]